MKNAIIASFPEYNARRYSMPWVCEMKEDGSYDFGKRIGTYSGGKGCAGELVVFAPEADKTYGFGQKDYRGNNTEIHYAKWNGERFIPCNKLGNAIPLDT